MRFSGVSALAIWNSAVRTLTTLGAGAFVPQSVVNSTIAANATTSFAQLATRALIQVAASSADASGTVVIQFTDGTNIWTVVTIAAGATGGQDSMLSTQNVFYQMKNNSATVAAKLWWTAYAFTQ